MIEETAGHRVRASEQGKWCPGREGKQHVQHLLPEMSVKKMSKKELRSVWLLTVGCWCDQTLNPKNATSNRYLSISAYIYIYIYIYIYMYIDMDKDIDIDVDI